MQNSPKFDKDREFKNHVEEPSLPQPPQGWGNVRLVIMVASLITLKKEEVFFGIWKLNPSHPFCTITQ